MNPQEKIGVLQLTDSLILGGAERVTVNLANLLPRDRYDSHLCVTRHDGPLAAEVSADVPKLMLERRNRWDEPRAVAQLVRYIRENRIRVLHCHKNSIFIGRLAAFFARDVALIWHAHGPKYVREHTFPYRLIKGRIDAAISVDQELSDVMKRRIGINGDWIWYLPNFIATQSGVKPPSDLPGEPGLRVVCVGNARPAKDFLNLVRAMKRVTDALPKAQLLIAGTPLDRDYGERLDAEIRSLGLNENVSALGVRSDVPEILAGCDVGVMSSMSEGFPLTLLEYGAAGLASVSTDVGQCAEILADGEVGELVPASDSDALGAAILGLLRDPERRSQLGRRFQKHAEHHYGAESILQRICDIYDRVLARRS